VTPQSVAAVQKNLPAKHEYQLVPNAGHNAFFLCPPALVKAVPELCTDAPGFDRVASTSNSMRLCSPFFDSISHGRAEKRVPHGLARVGRCAPPTLSG
jgi:hypothetical protein